MEELKYSTTNRRGECIEYSRKIDLLASSTTLFNKDFGTLKRDGCLFYRQLRDNGFGTLMLFPNDIKQRINKEKFIRDQVAFNLVILACSQV